VRTEIVAGLAVTAVAALVGTIYKLSLDIGILNENYSEISLGKYALKESIPDIEGYALKADIPALVNTENYVKKGDIEGVPVGSVLHINNTDCPNDNWRILEKARGRYIVGLNLDGQLGNIVGSPLKNSEQRQVVGVHSHTSVENGVHSHPIANAGQHAHGYSSTANGTLWDNGSNIIGGQQRFGKVGGKTTTSTGAHSHVASDSAAHTHTINETGSDQSIAAPYIQLLACEKVR